MHISELSVKRPVFAAVISCLLVVVGTLSFRDLPVREYPDINPPIVSVETRYTGASASVVDTRITQVIEDNISGIEGIRSISSQSLDGESRITIEFNLNRDIDSASNDVRERVSRVLDNLPQEADPPEIYKVDSSGDVIMWMNFTSNTLSGLELTDYAKRYVVDRLSTVDGVARVRVGGSREYSMRIWLDRDAMAARGVTVGDIENALRAENVELPAGRVESHDRYFTVRTERGYNTVDDFRNLVVGKGQDGHLIRLAEVADVTIGAVEFREELRGNAQPMVGIGIVAQSTANTLEVSRGVRAEVQRMADSFPEGTAIYESFDRTIFIEESINEIYRSFAIAVVLVIFVIFLFLGSVRAVLIPAVTVPISLISSLIFLKYMGYSLNLLTLLALLLAIGLVVDDAIVVLENIYRRIHLGESPGLASVRGSKQVSFAVIATTLVLISVFVPIGFLSGNTGRLFSEFAFAMAASVGFSSVIALTLSPMMCSYLLSSRQTEGRLAQHIDRNLKGLASLYRRTLEVALRHRLLVAAITLLVITAAVFFFKRIPNEFAPIEDRGTFMVTMRGPEGASFEFSQRYMREIEKELMPFHEQGDAKRILVRTPGGFGTPTSFNDGRAIVVLEDFDKRERSSFEIMADVSKRLQRLAGVQAFPVSRSGLTNSSGEPIQFVIGGSTYEELREWRDIILEEAAKYPGLINLNSDYRETRPQLSINILRERAADVGVSLRQIGQTLETFFGSRRVTTYLDRGEEYDVILQGSDENRRTPKDMDNIYVRSETTGSLIPLSNLVEVVEFADAGSLNRYNRLRAITISANLVDGYTLGEALDHLNQIAREKLPSLAQIDYKGESRDYIESQGAIYFVFIFAIIVVYLVLAAQFESLIHPITILLTVPLAVAGAYFGLWLMGDTLNIFSQIGIVMLAGLAAKNGILIVEFANQLRDDGMPLREALLRASELRLRPVLMTAISTVFGAIPLIVATGAGSENRFTIGVVIVFGVTVSSILTLYTVPWAYSLLGRFTSSPASRSKRIDQEAQAKAFVE